jgi:hypothetical protein
MEHINHCKWCSREVEVVTYESGSLVTTRIILAKKALTLYVEEHARGLSLGKERQTDHNKALMMWPTTANINQMKVQ